MATEKTIAEPRELHNHYPQCVGVQLHCKPKRKKGAQNVNLLVTISFNVQELQLGEFVVFFGISQGELRFRLENATALTETVKYVPAFVPGREFNSRTSKRKRRGFSLAPRIGWSPVGPEIGVDSSVGSQTETVDDREYLHPEQEFAVEGVPSEVVEPLWRFRAIGDYPVLRGALIEDPFVILQAKSKAFAVDVRFRTFRENVRVTEVKVNRLDPLNWAKRLIIPIKAQREIREKTNYTFSEGIVRYV